MMVLFSALGWADLFTAIDSTYLPMSKPTVIHSEGRSVATLPRAVHYSYVCFELPWNQLGRETDHAIHCSGTAI